MQIQINKYILNYRIMKKLMLFAVVGLVAAFSFTSCNDDNNNQTADPKSFKVRMTDSPGNYTSLNMTITGVDAYCEGSGWITLSSQTQAVNVASLTNGSETTIANASSVQSGHYTHLRVKFSSSASLVVNSSGSGSGSNFNLTWNVPQDIDVVIDKQINDSQGANILLDFDIAQSVIQVGSSYHIQPIITVISNENTGVKGHVTGASSAAIVFTGNGHTYGGYMNSSGYFLVRGMASGTYTCTVYKNSETNDEHIVNNVVVSEGQIYNMGEIAL
jgi:hypothetical protein